MKNADMPAMPQTEEDFNDAGEYILLVRGGLTKREYFATMAMPRIDVHGYDVRDTKGVALIAAKMAIETADALLAELERIS